MRRRQITQTASQTHNGLSEPTPLVSHEHHPKQSQGNSRTDSIGRVLLQSTTENPDAATRAGGLASAGTSHTKAAHAAQSLNTNQQAIESLVNYNIKTAKNPLYKSSKADRGLRPVLNDYPASHPQRAHASSFKGDAKDLGQSKSMGTALLKHKIQSHLKNRLLTPLKEQRLKDSKKQSHRNADD